MNSCFESLEGRMGKNRVREFVPKAGKKRKKKEKRIANTSTKLLIKKATQLQEDVRRQLVTRYGMAVGSQGAPLPFDRFVFNLAGCPYYTPSSPGNLVGEMV